MTDLTGQIDKKATYALNLSQTGLSNLLLGDERMVVRSDEDEQILIHFAFNEAVTLSSIKLVCADQHKKNAPKKIKLFSNRVSMSFADCEDPASQELILSPNDTSKDSPPVALKPVKFTKIVSLTLFIESNQSDDDVTFLSAVKIFGQTIQTTKMGDLKKINDGHEHD